MNVPNDYRDDANRWLLEFRTLQNYGKEEMTPGDALAVLCHMLELGYRRAMTTASRRRWLRLVCGYLMFTRAETSDVYPEYMDT